MGKIKTVTQSNGTAILHQMTYHFSRCFFFYHAMAVLWNGIQNFFCACCTYVYMYVFGERAKRARHSQV